MRLRPTDPTEIALWTERQLLRQKEKKKAAEENMEARVKEDGKRNTDISNKKNEISTPIQPQHLSNESARLKWVNGTREFFMVLWTMGIQQKTLDKLTDQPGILIPLDRGGVLDLSVSGINVDFVVVRPSRSDYDERTRCANAIAEPYLQWLPTSRCEVSLITKIIFPARSR
jgi:hypothetical protein